MKKGLIAVIILLVVIIGLLAFLVFKGPSLSNQKSTDTGGAEQETSSGALKDYIDIISMKGKLSGKITPAEGKKIKGIIEVTLTKVPANTAYASFGVVPSGQQPTGQEMRADTDGSDGWSFAIDTNNYVNGLYDVIVLALAQPAEGSGDDGPLDAAVVQVIIEN